MTEPGELDTSKWPPLCSQTQSITEGDASMEVGDATTALMDCTPGEGPPAPEPEAPSTGENCSTFVCTRVLSKPVPTV